MNEIANTTTNVPARLDDLAADARLCVQSISLNLYRLGRILIEAKSICPHGEWAQWVQDNAGDMSLRKAEDLMAACERFGGRPQFDSIGQTKLFKMLALPEGTEDQFLKDNDVEAMTTRQVSEAVKRVRAEAQAEIDRERAAREAAERRAEALVNREPEVPASIAEEMRQLRAENEQQRGEIQRQADMNRDTLGIVNQLRTEKTRLERDVEEQDELLREQQEAFNQAQVELLNLKSAQKRGDVGRNTSDDLTLEVFSAAVREFMGVCARVPYMSATFSAMPHAERTRFDELLRTIEGWTESARRALDSFTVEGGFVDE